MIGYKCKKCNCESPEPVCRQCGRKLSMNTMRDMWSVWHTPLKDGAVWKRLILFILICAVSAMLVLMIVETIVARNFGSAVFMLGSGLAAYILAVCIISVLIATLFLAMQGKETLIYVLDVQGAHMQLWHGATRRQCLARLQKADLKKAVPQQDGSSLILAHTQHLLWGDVENVAYRPDRGEILLYRTGKIAPMVLRLPPEEYAPAENLVKRFCKNKQ